MTDSLTKVNETASCRSGHWYCMPTYMWVTVALCLFLSCTTFVTSAQEEPEFEELSVFFQVQNIGAIEIPAVIRDQEVLLPVSELFTFLKIKNTLSSEMDSVSGFFLSPDAPYLIDRTKNSISFQGKNYQLKNTDFIRTETNLYLLSRFFGEIFGLDCKYNPRALAVNLTTQLELPVMREMRLEQMRQNINRLKGDAKSDSTIRLSRKAFNFGMADWSVISTQNFTIGQNSNVSNGSEYSRKQIDTRINLALGAVVAGGEANILLNYDTNEPFSEKQQSYYWRLVNNNNILVKQTTLGKIATGATSSIYNPVVGVRLTNTPTTYRRSFGTYPLSDYTNPGWMVELYVNNVLVDYKKADASGFFNFQVPLVYGNSSVKLKFYGPWGEERFREQQINVPFNFLPPGEVEYTLNAGMVEDGKQSIFSRGEVHYGLSRAITLGSGVEFLSSVVSGPIMPFLSMATRPFSNVLLSAEYTYGVRGKGMFSIQLPKNSQLELNYIKYQPGQKAVNYNYLEERKATLTLPIKGRNISMFNRFTYGQILLPGTGYSTAEWLISGAIYGISTNLSNYAMFTNSTKPYIYSNLSMSFRLPRGIMLLPQAQYEFSNKELISVKAGLEKYLFRNGFVSLSYENNFKSKVHSAQFGFRYDLPFAQTGYTARQTNDQTTIMEMARGSLIFDPKTNYIGANSKVNVGRGGIVFAPFLDLNCNNRRDNGEPRADGLDIRINGGTSTYSEKDTTVRVTDLEPYTSYLVELDANSFDNVAWKIRNKVLKIVVDPNSFKLVNIPVAVVGEVSGIVYKENGDEQDGLGRIIINIFNSKSQLSGKTLSEPDGYYSYLGLAPGVYDVSVDSVQLRKLHLQATPIKQSITILKSQDGDIVEGIDFTLKSTRSEVIDTLDNDSKNPPSDLTIPVQPQTVSTQNVQPSQAIASQNIPQKQVIPNPSIPVQQQAVSSQNAQPSQAIASQNIPQKQVIPNPIIPVQQQVIPKPDISLNQTTPNQNIPPKQDVSNPAIPVPQQVIPKADISLNQTTTNQNIPPKKVVSNPTIPVQQQVIAKPDISLNQATAKQNIPPKQINTHPILQPQRIIEDQNKGRQMGQTFLQVGAFKGINNARRLSDMLGKTMNYPIELVHEDGWYKVRFGAFSDSRSADLCRTEILANGIISADQIKEINLQGSFTSANNQVKPIASTSANEQVIQADPILPAKVVVPVIPPATESAGIAAPIVEAPATIKIAKSEKYLQKHYFVQVGAFAIPKNATRMKKNIAPLVAYAVEIVFRDQLYKVRFGPFETQVELNNCIRQVVQSGIMTRELMKIYYEEIGATPLVDQPHVMTGFHIQVGAFKDKINATKFYHKMSGEYAFPALIAEEDGYYKVRFGPFKSLSETKKYSKELEKNRVDCFIRNNTVNYF